MKKVPVGKLDVLSVFVAWVLLIAFFASLTFSLIFAEPYSSVNHLIYLFGVFAFAGILHIVLAFFNRCPYCKKCLTVQGFKEPHPDSSGS